MDSLRFLKLAFTSRGSIEELYEFLKPANLLVREKRYVNLGFWDETTPDLDAAGEALADLLARQANLKPSDEVLDAGFGFGEQDFFWIQKYGPKRVHGINLCGTQIQTAQDRARDLGLESRCIFQLANATKLPFANRSFDVVFALESAFHFDTRQAFLNEAFRVLRPGGRLVMADLLGDVSALAPHERMLARIGLNFWKMPAANMYPAPELARRLGSLGFQNINVESIWDRVHPHYIRFARKALESDEIKRRMNPLLRRMLLFSAKSRLKMNRRPMDYVIASAVKPNNA